jgi:transcriptional regulator with XRE-family HTH domain
VITHKNAIWQQKKSISSHRAFLSPRLLRMGTAGLSKREVSICRRLREARERLGWTQQRCADAIGIDRGSLTNYEYLKSPLRYQVALRFCRNLIVSEEWLATGKHAALERISRKLFGASDREDWRAFDKIFFRQCVDLLAEPAVLHSIRPGSLFSAAYDEVLAPRFAALAEKFFYTPRIVLSEHPEPDLALNFTDALVQRWLFLLENEAHRFTADTWLVQRNFVRAIFQTTAKLFREYVAHGLDVAFLQRFVSEIENTFLMTDDDVKSRKGSRRAAPSTKKKTLATLTELR